MNLCLLPNEGGFYIPVLYSILKKIKKNSLGTNRVCYEQKVPNIGKWLIYIKE